MGPGVDLTPPAMIDPPPVGAPPRRGPPPSGPPPVGAPPAWNGVEYCPFRIRREVIDL